MQFSTETIGRLLASGRGYAQFGVGAIASAGLVSAANSKGLSDGFADIFNGLVQTLHGVTSVWQISTVILAPIISFALAKWSSNSAKTVNQAASVQAAVLDPNTTIPPAVKDVIVSTAKAV